MGENNEAFVLVSHQFSTALAGLFLAVGGAMLSEPLMIISEENSDNISIPFVIYAFLFLFVPLTFFLNMLLLLTHVAACVADVCAPLEPLHVFFLKHLPLGALTASMGTLLLGFPLSVHVGLTVDGGGSTFGPCLVCFVWVIVLICSFCRTATGFAQALFAICVSTCLLPFVDPLLSFSNQNWDDPLIHIPIRFLAFFLIPFTFMVGMILLILRIAAPPDEQAATRAAYLVTVGALSAACATILVGMYTMAYGAVTDMARHY